MLTRVVACYRQPQVPVKQGYQPRQVRHASANVLFDPKAVADPELIGSLGHQLHQPHGTLGRYRVRLPARLHFDDGLHQLDRHVVDPRVIHDPAGRQSSALLGLSSVCP